MTTMTTGISETAEGCAYWLSVTNPAGDTVTTSSYQASGSVRNRERRLRTRVTRAGWLVSKNKLGFHFMPDDAPMLSVSRPLVLSLDEAELFASWLA